MGSRGGTNAGSSGLNAPRETVAQHNAALNAANMKSRRASPALQKNAAAARTRADAQREVNAGQAHPVSPRDNRGLPAAYRRGGG